MECHCGDLPEVLSGNITTFPVPNSEKLCDKPCSGNKEVMCGGLNAYSLYSTGLKGLFYYYYFYSAILFKSLVGKMIDTVDLYNRFL